MDMEMEAGLEPLLDRINAAATQLEQAAERLAAAESAIALEASHAGREADLEQQLAEAEATIASLKAAATTRKTQPTTATSLTAKDGVTIEAGALDTALIGLSIEQRIAVKAGLLRSGLLA